MREERTHPPIIAEPTAGYLAGMTGRQPMITAVIVEDEERSRLFLDHQLREHFPHVQLLGSAGTVDHGIDLVRTRRPQILFLDIELHDRTGFELLEAVGAERPHVIFTTAFESYAVRAIRFCALDYLLKPVGHEELGSALKRASEALSHPQHPEQFKALLQNLAQAREVRRKLALPVEEGLHLVEIDDILFCTSSGHFTTVHLMGGKAVTVNRDLRVFEEMLDAGRFLRVHHSYLVNLQRVQRYVRGEGGELVMADGSRVLVSRRKKPELMAALPKK